MKRTILINQEILFKIDENLDFNDGAILHYIIDFSHVAKKMLDCGASWFWISSSKIVKDMPLLKIKTNRGIAKRVDKLVDAGLLLRHPENQNTGQSFYCFGEKYQFLIEWNESSTPGTKVPTPLEQPFQPPWNESSDYSSIKDISITDKKGVSLKTDSPSLFPDLPDPKKESTFKNSAVADFSIFEKKFTGQEFKTVDIFYYFNAVKDWSLTKSKVFRTSDGWIATARNFMRRDKESNKLRVLKTETESEDYLEYLKQSHGDS